MGDDRVQAGERDSSVYTSSWRSRAWASLSGTRVHPSVERTRIHVAIGRAAWQHAPRAGSERPVELGDKDACWAGSEDATAIDPTAALIRSARVAVMAQGRLGGSLSVSFPDTAVTTG